MTSKNVMVDHAGFIFVLFFGIHSKERKQGDQMWIGKLSWDIQNQRKDKYVNRSLCLSVSLPLWLNHSLKCIRSLLCFQTLNDLFRIWKHSQKEEYSDRYCGAKGISSSSHSHITALLQNISICLWSNHRLLWQHLTTFFANHANQTQLSQLLLTFFGTRFFLFRLF